MASACNWYFVSFFLKYCSQLRMRKSLINSESTSPLSHKYQIIWLMTRLPSLSNWISGLSHSALICGFFSWVNSD